MRVMNCDLIESSAKFIYDKEVQKKFIHELVTKWTPLRYLGMMDINQDKIEILVIRYINGQISAEEQVYLEGLIRNSPEVWRLWKDTKERLDRADFKEYMATHSTRQQYGKLLLHIAKRKRRRTVGTFILVIAIVVILTMLANRLSLW